LLRTLIERHGAEALLLHMPEENWSREANAILPTYQLGGLYESEEGVSMNAYRLSVEIQRVAAHLHSLGHERIMVPIGNFAEGMRESTIKALAAGVGKKPAKGTWADHCPRFAESLPEAWERYWKSAFAKLNPTAVILIEDVHLLSLYGYCAANRIAIPDALSVVLMAWNPQFEWCVPMPCMHRFPLAKSTYLFKRWIANGMKVTGAKYLPLDPLDGKSVAAPRKR
jgi:DNA-binding LacI/PurR family transcriptional regulator